MKIPAVLRSYVSRIRPAGEDRRSSVEVAVDSVRVDRARVSSPDPVQAGDG
jgi:hypothetical protein